MSRSVQTLALIFLLGSGSATAQNRPAGWTSTEIILPRCGESSQAFETVTEWRDERRVRELSFSRWSTIDAHSDLTLEYDAPGKLRTVTWNVTGDWDYGRLKWVLDTRGNVVSILGTGRQDGVPYTHALLPQQTPLPDAYRLLPLQAAYHRLGCAFVPWPSP